MKKKAITLLLSFVLASGSMGNVQLLAAETTEQKADAAQEAETTAHDAESVQEEEKDDAAAAEDTAADMSGQETEEETVQENAEQFLENEDPEAEETVDEEELDTSEEAAAEALETEDEITDESEDALAGTVDSGCSAERENFQAGVVGKYGCLDATLCKPQCGRVRLDDGIFGKRVAVFNDFLVESDVLQRLEFVVVGTEDVCKVPDFAGARRRNNK